MSQEENPKASAASLSKRTAARPRRPLKIHRIQNFSVVWLDTDTDEVHKQDSINTILKFREVVNTINTFTNVDECVDFITDFKEKTFIIISDTFGPRIIPLVHDIPQISTIYIFCDSETHHEQWLKEWPKIQGVFTNIKPVCEALKQAVHIHEQNNISMNFRAPTSGTTIQNLNELDQSFMNTQILKEILLTIEFEQQHIDDFVSYCREQFADYATIPSYVDKLEQEYDKHTPIWWYTAPCFLYSMLNCALRLMEVELIVNLGFFIRDLHQHIAQLHSEQYTDHQNVFIVYRGQGLSQTDFNHLKNNIGGLLSFNNFLSTSMDAQISLTFADSSIINNLVGILFVIKIDPSLSTIPFANIRDVSYYGGEEEILFSMHSVFRIEQMEEIDGNDRLWQVDLILTSDNDPQLQAVTDYMREEIFPQRKGWERLTNFLIRLGQFDKAQQVCEVLLDRKNNDCEVADIYHSLGMVRGGQGLYAEAITFYERSIEIKEKTLSHNHGDVASSYDGMGVIYTMMSQYSKALLSHETALEIYGKILPPNHPELTTYSNIGVVYDLMGEYSKALSFHEKALEIRQKMLPSNHPKLAVSYSNIGSTYVKMNEYSKALSSHEKALEIKKKTLPPNHPSLSYSYENIGGVYEQMGEYSKALSSHEKALDIRQKMLPPNHPDLATSYNNIGVIYQRMDENAKALSSLEKALEIRQKVLPAYHPDLASSYNNIGGLYGKMDEYSKALSSHEKALEIFQKTLPPNHPSLATSYNNIGLIYSNLGEHTKALTFHEKALEICQKTFPPNHPDLAFCYEHIGTLSFMIGENPKAILYCERALQIIQNSLPSNHPDVQLFKRNLEFITKKI